MKEHCNSLRLIHYYPLVDDGASDRGVYRCGPHYDTGSLTLLLQDRPGLEINPMNGAHSAWHPIRDLPPSAILVNIGDLMAQVSNDRWVSTYHRVPIPVDPIESASSRISIVLFQTLAADFRIESAVCAGETPKYTPTTQGAHLMQHFDSMS